MCGLGNFRITQAFLKGTSLTGLVTNTEIKTGHVTSANKVLGTGRDLLSTGLLKWYPVKLGVFL